MTRTWRWLGCSVIAATLGCDPPPPIKTSSGTRITGVAYQETFARSENTTDVTFHGERLKKAVALMDKHGVFALDGNFAAKGVLDSASLVLAIDIDGGKPKTIALKNCAEPHVCAFMTEAVTTGIVERMPVACKQPNACNPVK